MPSLEYLSLIEALIDFGQLPSDGESSPLCDNLFNQLSCECDNSFVCDCDYSFTPIFKCDHPFVCDCDYSFSSSCDWDCDDSVVSESSLEWDLLTPTHSSEISFASVVSLDIASLCDENRFSQLQVEEVPDSLFECDYPVKNRKRGNKKEKCRSRVKSVKFSPCVRHQFNNNARPFDRDPQLLIQLRNKIERLVSLRTGVTPVHEEIAFCEQMMKTIELEMYSTTAAGKKATLNHRLSKPARKIEDLVVSFDQIDEDLKNLLVPDEVERLQTKLLEVVRKQLDNPEANLSVRTVDKLIFKYITEARDFEESLSQDFGYSSLDKIEKWCHSYSDLWCYSSWLYIGEVRYNPPSSYGSTKRNAISSIDDMTTRAFLERFPRLRSVFLTYVPNPTMQQHIDLTSIAVKAQQLKECMVTTLSKGISNIFSWLGLPDTLDEHCKNFVRTVSNFFGSLLERADTTLQILDRFGRTIKQFCFFIAGIFAATVGLLGFSLFRKMLYRAQVAQGVEISDKYRGYFGVRDTVSTVYDDPAKNKCATSFDHGDDLSGRMVRECIRNGGEEDFNFLKDLIYANEARLRDSVNGEDDADYKRDLTVGHDENLLHIMTAATYVFDEKRMAALRNYANSLKTPEMAPEVVLQEQSDSGFAWTQKGMLVSLLASFCLLGREPSSKYMKDLFSYLQQATKSARDIGIGIATTAYTVVLLKYIYRFFLGIEDPVVVFEDKVRVVRQKMGVISGFKCDPRAFAAGFYSKILDEVREDLEDMLKTAQSNPDLYKHTTELARFYREVLSIQVKIEQCTVTDVHRNPPFVAHFIGDPGQGKSQTVEHLLYDGFGVEREFVYNVPIGSEFWTGMFKHPQVVVWDEFLMTASRDVDTGVFMSLVNCNRFQPPMADLAPGASGLPKGTSIQPDTVILMSNYGFPIPVNSPPKMAVWRRRDALIEVKSKLGVNPSYKNATLQEKKDCIHSEYRLLHPTMPGMAVTPYMDWPQMRYILSTMRKEKLDSQTVIKHTAKRDFARSWIRLFGSDADPSDLLTPEKAIPAPVSPPEGIDDDILRRALSGDAVHIQQGGKKNKKSNRVENSNSTDPSPDLTQPPPFNLVALVSKAQSDSSIATDTSFKTAENSSTVEDYGIASASASIHFRQAIAGQMEILRPSQKELADVDEVASRIALESTGVNFKAAVLRKLKVTDDLIVQRFEDPFIRTCSQSEFESFIKSKGNYIFVDEPLVKDVNAFTGSFSVSDVVTPVKNFLTDNLQEFGLITGAIAAIIAILRSFGGVRDTIDRLIPFKSMSERDLDEAGDRAEKSALAQQSPKKNTRRINVRTGKPVRVTFSEQKTRQYTIIKCEGDKIFLGIKGQFAVTTRHIADHCIDKNLKYQNTSTGISKTFTLRFNDVFCHEEYDLAVVDFRGKNLGAFSDISRRLISLDDFCETESCHVTLAVDDPSRTNLSANARFSESVPIAELTGGQRRQWKLKGYRAAIKGVAGDCGFPYIIDSGPLTNKILGIHCAGTAGAEDLNPTITKMPELSLCAPLPKEFVFDCISEFNSEDVEENFILAPHNGNTEEFLGERDCVVPRKERVFMSTTSKISKSTIGRLNDVNQYFEELKVPSVMDIERGMRQMDHLDNLTLPGEVDPVILDLASQVVFDNFRNLADTGEPTDITKPCTVKDVVNGIPGIMQSWNRRTSAGYPLCYGRNGKYHLVTNDEPNQILLDELDVIDNLCLEIEKGGKPDLKRVRYLAYFKDELLKKSKVEIGDVRLTYCGNAALGVRVKERAAALMRWYQLNWRRTPTTIGVNPLCQDSKEIFDYLLEVTPICDPKGFYDIDVKHWDRHLRFEFMHKAFELIGRQIEYIGQLNDYQVDTERWKSLSHLILHAPIQFNDRFVFPYHGLKSGHPITTMANCVVHELMWVYSYILTTKRTDFYHNVRNRYHGDDVIASFRKEIKEIYNPKVHAEVFAELGMTMTDGSKTGAPQKDGKPYWDIEFLACKPGVSFVYGEEYHHGIIKASSVEQSLLWTKSDEVSRFMMCCRLAATRGKRYYDQIVKIVSGAMGKDWDLISDYICDWETTIIDISQQKDDSDWPWSMTQHSVNMSLQMLSVKDVREQQGVTSFENPSEPIRQTGTLALPKQKTINESPRLDVDDAFGSDIFRADIVWDSSMPAGSIIYSVEVPFGLLASGDNDNMQNFPFLMYVYFRFNTILKLVKTGGPAVGGTALAYFRPLARPDQPLSIAAALAMKPNIIFAPGQQVHETKIDFQFIREMLNSHAAAEADEQLGTFFIQVMQPVIAASETTSDKVQMTLYSRFEEVERSMVRPTGFQNQTVRQGARILRSERYNIRPRNFKEARDPLNAVFREQGGGSSKNITETTVYNVNGAGGQQSTELHTGGNTADSTGGSGSGELAMPLPMDNPRHQMFGPVVNQTFAGGMSRTTGFREAMSMQMDPAVSNIQSGLLGRNESAIETLANRWLLVSEFTWSGSDNVNTILMDIPVTVRPTQFNSMRQQPWNAWKDPGSRLHDLLFGSVMFWRADVNVTVIVGNNDLTTGKLRGNFIPGASSVEVPGTSIGYRHVFDITANARTTTWKIPFAAATPVLMVPQGDPTADPVQNHTMGWLSLSVETVLGWNFEGPALADVTVMFSYENVEVYGMQGSTGVYDRLLTTTEVNDPVVMKQHTGDVSELPREHVDPGASIYISDDTNKVVGNAKGVTEHDRHLGHRITHVEELFRRMTPVLIPYPGMDMDLTPQFRVRHPRVAVGTYMASEPLGANLRYIALEVCPPASPLIRAFSMWSGGLIYAIAGAPGIDQFKEAANRAIVVYCPRGYMDDTTAFAENGRIADGNFLGMAMVRHFTQEVVPSTDQFIPGLVDLFDNRPVGTTNLCTRLAIEFDSAAAPGQMVVHVPHMSMFPRLRTERLIGAPEQCSLGSIHIMVPLPTNSDGGGITISQAVADDFALGGFTNQSWNPVLPSRSLSSFNAIVMRGNTSYINLGNTIYRNVKDPASPVIGDQDS